MPSITYQSRLSILYLGFGVIGAVLSGSIAYLMARAEWVAEEGTSQTTMLWLGYGLLACFTGFTGICVAMVLAAKRLVIETDAVYINRPLLFHRRRIPLDQIARISFGDYEIKSAYRMQDFTVYKGKKTSLHLKGGRVAHFNTFEIGNYYTSVAHLQNERLRSPVKLDYVSLRHQDQDWQGYGWLLFMVVITGGVVISVFG